MSFEKEMEILRSNSSHWEIGPKRKKTIIGMVKRFGNDIVPDFNRLITNPYYTLQNIADKYNVSRERIRQLVFSVYGFKYTHFLTKLRGLKQDDRIYCSRHPVMRKDKQGGSSEYQAFLKLKGMGFSVKASPTNHFDMVCNEYNIEVKSANKSITTGTASKTRYYHFGSTKYETEVCDYYICHAIDVDRWYIFQNFRKGQKVTQHFYIRSNGVRLGNQRKNTFADPTLHENNWQILKRPN